MGVIILTLLAILALATCIVVCLYEVIKDIYRWKEILNDKEADEKPDSAKNGVIRFQSTENDPTA